MKTFTNLAHRAFKKCASLGTTNRNRYYLFTIIMLLTLGVGNAWAETIVLKASDGFQSSYQSSDQTFTKSEITFGYLRTMYNANGTPTGWYKQQLMQLSKNASSTVGGDIWNVTSVNIAKITVKLAVNNNDFTLFYGTSAKPSTNSIAKSDASSSTETITYSGYSNKTEQPGQTTTINVFTFDLSGKGATHFLIDNGSKANYIWEIVIETSSATPDPVDPTVTFSDGSYTVGDAALDLSSLWTSTSTGEVTYKVANAGTTGASISGKSFTATAAGTCTVKASQAATSAYNAIEKTATITITAPTPATITLSEAGQEKTVEGKYVGDSYELPLTSTQTCGTKTFVGWSTKEIATPGDKPTSNFYEPGATVTLSAEQTFYAVYATEGEGAAEPEEVTWSYDFFSFSGTSVQYKEETHDLGGGVTINIKDCNINDQLRIYSSDANNGYVISNKLPGTIKSMKFNAGYKADVLVVYGSTDGNTWDQVGEVSVTSTSYNDYTLSFGATNYTYFKLDVKGTQQIRVAKMSITYMSEGGVTTTYSDYTTSCGATPTIYNVTIAGDIQNGTVKASPTSAAEGATITLIVTPADGYMLNTLAVADENSNLISVTGNKFEMPASNVTVSATFKEIPAATLTLSKNGDTSDKIEGKVGDVIILPDFTSDCSKTFVGWDSKSDCTDDPEYKAGAEYTLAAETQTLYAVYADVVEGASVNMFSETFDACEGKGANGDEAWSGTGIAAATLTLDGWTCEKGNAANGCAKFGATSAKGSAETPAIAITGNATLSFRAGAWDNAAEVTTLNLSATGANLSQSSITLTKAAWTEYTIHITEATGSVKIKFEASVKDKNRFFLDDVVVSQASVAYSNYSTTCVAALDVPVFSVEGGENEAKTITLTATEGTIYYTLDGSTPTASSEKYTTPIVLDECGTTTIKAIAIGAGSQSPVASATYTINLPITNTDATAYTPAEAIAIIDGACDKTEEVYVKGVVVSTSGLNTEYGNYDNVVVKAVDDESATPKKFTFFRLFKAAEKTKFTASDEVIGVGDVITAKGKLTKYNTTYELAEGCYMVERVANVKLESELAWSTDAVTLYEGDPFTAPTLSNPNVLTGITYESSNEAVATVTADGIIALAGALGTTTVTATYDGNVTYKQAEVSCTITVKRVPEASCDGSDDFATLDANSAYETRTTTDGWKATNAAVAEIEGDNYFIINGKTSTVGTITSPELNGGIGSIKIRYANTYNEEHGVSFRLDIKQNGEVVKNYTITKANEDVVKGTVYTELIKNINIEGDFQMVFTNLSPSNSTSNKDRVSIGRLCWTGYVAPTLVTPSVESGIFSVGAGKYVQFSTGNLQYEVGTNTWSFASEQYEVIGGEAYTGSNNTNYGMNVPGYTGKLDLFAWSCDGKFGVNPSNADADYKGEFADWGNLVDGEDNWYTLTKEEMNYILNRKKDGKKLWATAELAGKVVLILLPDNWDITTALEYGYVPATGNFEENVLTIDDWKALEEKGAVLLPSGGSRTGGYGNKIGFDGETKETDDTRLDANGYYFHVNNVGDYGYYWLNTTTSSEDCVDCAAYLITPGFIENDPTKTEDDQYTSPQVPSREKRRGNSVRLVKEVPAYTVSVTAENGTVTGAGTYPQGAEVTLTATANEGYKFTSWSNDETANPYTFTVTEDVTLSANFEVATVEPVIYTRATTAGKFGTICLPFGSTNYTGMELYEFVGKEEGKAYLGSVTTLVAGVPYIFLASAAQVVVTSDGTTAATPGYSNGLYGTFTDNTEVAVGNYILKDNAICECTATCWVNANRAYIVWNEIPAGAPQQMPGRKYIGMDAKGENAATGLDNITNGENTTIKVIENGQLIIIRNGEKFNAQGQRL